MRTPTKHTKKSRLIRSVATSTAIETGEKWQDIEKRLLMKSLADYALEKVKEFRTASGLPCDNGVMANHDLHHKLYTEEFNEYHEATDDSEKADSYADQLVVAAGYQLDAGTDYFVPFPQWPKRDYWQIVEHIKNLSQLDGIDILEAFNIAHNSNMTKFTKDHSVITESVDWYNAKGIEVTAKKTNGYWALFSAKDQSVGEKHYPKGKLLKPLTFVEPDWSGGSWKLR